jgi:hypothetical protein
MHSVLLRDLKDSVLVLVLESVGLGLLGYSGSLLFL